MDQDYEKMIAEKKKKAGDFIALKFGVANKIISDGYKISNAIGNVFDLGKDLNNIIKKDSFLVISDYKMKLSASMKNLTDHSKLQFISGQIAHIQSKITEYNLSSNKVDRSIYESILIDILYPAKKELQELVRVNNGQDVGSTGVNSSTIPLTKETNEVGQIDKVLDQIDIPVIIIDQPFQTKTGKALNNQKYISGIRKFTWADKRIPHILADILFESGLIFHHQVTHLKEFLNTGRCHRKIVFNGNGNILTTMLFELKQKGYLKTSNEFVADRIQTIFVKKENTLEHLISKVSVQADLKPTNIIRRLKKGSSNYIDIIPLIETQLSQIS